MRLVAAPVFLTGLLVVGACGVDATREGDEVEPVPASAKTSDVADVPDRSAQEKIIAFGDSLTAGFGIGQNEAYPAALQVLIDEKGYPYEVINAGVSGETSAGGVRRLDWVLDDRDVAVLILELGANDGLRGLPPKEMAKNLNIIIDAAESRDIPVLLAGLSTDADNASRFLREFMEAYEKVAAERGVTFMPHFLDNVAGVEELNQSDGSHPNAAGARIVADNVWEFLEPMLNTLNAANP